MARRKALSSQVFQGMVTTSYFESRSVMTCQQRLQLPMASRFSLEPSPNLKTPNFKKAEVITSSVKSLATGPNCDSALIMAAATCSGRWHRPLCINTSNDCNVHFQTSRVAVAVAGPQHIQLSGVCLSGAALGRLTQMQVSNDQHLQVSSTKVISSFSPSSVLPVASSFLITRHLPACSCKQPVSLRCIWQVLLCRPASPVAQLGRPCQTAFVLSDSRLQLLSKLNPSLLQLAAKHVLKLSGGPQLHCALQSLALKKVALKKVAQLQCFNCNVHTLKQVAQSSPPSPLRQRRKLAATLFSAPSKSGCAVDDAALIASHTSNLPAGASRQRQQAQQGARLRRSVPAARHAKLACHDTSRPCRRSGAGTSAACLPTRRQLSAATATATTRWQLSAAAATAAATATTATTTTTATAAATATARARWQPQSDLVAAVRTCRTLLRALREQRREGQRCLTALKEVSERLVGSCRCRQRQKLATKPLSQFKTGCDLDDAALLSSTAAHYAQQARAHVEAVKSSSSKANFRNGDAVVAKSRVKPACWQLFLHHGPSYRVQPVQGVSPDAATEPLSLGSSTAGRGEWLSNKHLLHASLQLGMLGCFANLCTSSLSCVVEVARGLLVSRQPPLANQLVGSAGSSKTIVFAARSSLKTLVPSHSSSRKCLLQDKLSVKGHFLAVEHSLQSADLAHDAGLATSEERPRAWRGGQVQKCPATKSVQSASSEDGPEIAAKVAPSACRPRGNNNNKAQQVRKWLPLHSKTCFPTCTLRSVFCKSGSSVEEAPATPSQQPTTLFSMPQVKLPLVHVMQPLLALPASSKAALQHAGELFAAASCAAVMLVKDGQVFSSRQTVGIACRAPAALLSLQAACISTAQTGSDLLPAFTCRCQEACEAVAEAWPDGRKPASTHAAKGRILTFLLEEAFHDGLHPKLLRRSSEDRVRFEKSVAFSPQLLRVHSAAQVSTSRVFSLRSLGSSSCALKPRVAESSPEAQYFCSLPTRTAALSLPALQACGAKSRGFSCSCMGAGSSMACGGQGGQQVHCFSHLTTSLLQSPLPAVIASDSADAQGDIGSELTFCFLILSRWFPALGLSISDACHSKDAVYGLSCWKRTGSSCQPWNPLEEQQQQEVAGCSSSAFFSAAGARGVGSMMVFARMIALPPRTVPALSSVFSQNRVPSVGTLRMSGDLAKSPSFRFSSTAPGVVRLACTGHCHQKVRCVYKLSASLLAKPLFILSDKQIKFRPTTTSTLTIEEVLFCLLISSNWAVTENSSQAANAMQCYVATGAPVTLQNLTSLAPVQRPSSKQIGSGRPVPGFSLIPSLEVSPAGGFLECLLAKATLKLEARVMATRATNSAPHRQAATGASGSCMDKVWVAPQQAYRVPPRTELALSSAFSQKCVHFSCTAPGLSNVRLACTSHCQQKMPCVYNLSASLVAQPLFILSDKQMSFQTTATLPLPVEEVLICLFISSSWALNSSQPSFTRRPLPSICMPLCEEHSCSCSQAAARGIGTQKFEARIIAAGASRNYSHHLQTRDGPANGASSGRCMHEVWAAPQQAYRVPPMTELALPSAFSQKRVHSLGTAPGVSNVRLACTSHCQQKVPCVYKFSASLLAKPLFVLNDKQISFGPTTNSAITIEEVLICLFISSNWAVNLFQASYAVHRFGASSARSPVQNLAYVAHVDRPRSRRIRSGMPVPGISTPFSLNPSLHGSPAGSFLDCVPAEARGIETLKFKAQAQLLATATSRNYSQESSVDQSKLRLTHQVGEAPFGFSLPRKDSSIIDFWSREKLMKLAAPLGGGCLVESNLHQSAYILGSTSPLKSASSASTGGFLFRVPEEQQQGWCSGIHEQALAATTTRATMLSRHAPAAGERKVLSLRACGFGLQAVFAAASFAAAPPACTSWLLRAAKPRCSSNCQIAARKESLLLHKPAASSLLFSDNLRVKAVSFLKTASHSLLKASSLLSHLVQLGAGDLAHDAGCCDGAKSVSVHVGTSQQQQQLRLSSFDTKQEAQTNSTLASPACDPDAVLKKQRTLSLQRSAFTSSRSRSLVLCATWKRPACNLHAQFEYTRRPQLTRAMQKPAAADATKTTSAACATAEKKVLLGIMPRTAAHVHRCFSAERACSTGEVASSMLLLASEFEPTTCNETKTLMLLVDAYLASSATLGLAGMNQLTRMLCLPMEMPCIQLRRSGIPTSALTPRKLVATVSCQGLSRLRRPVCKR
ncbi:unnamed protein product [Polarella glacialis]|uniref:Uncharacterized protein n=1 Tax=Polarella glacialis TaxID=89957 RepID=A0A813DRX9_POLGL|nr:unnamed protein product [Polarella glacialis]